MTSYAPATNRYHEGWIGEAQQHYAQVIAQDIYGNWQWQTVGPIYADVPTTPDYISDLKYHGWMESGCSQIGADREIARAAPSHSSLKDAQQLYLSWDDASLRFTWVGADWNSDGDLFIYLDTQSGGTTRAYDPYGTGPVITLPAQGGSQLAADYALWVEDENTARLLTWSGSAWISQTIDSAHWALDTSLRPPHTDLLIPRAWLGSPATLKLVALASEDTALRVWATMPDKNPLNSPRVINSIGLPFAGLELYAHAAVRVDDARQRCVPQPGPIRARRPARRAWSPVRPASNSVISNTTCRACLRPVSTSMRTWMATSMCRCRWTFNRR